MIKRIFLSTLIMALTFSLAGQGLSSIVLAAGHSTAITDLLTIALKNCAGVKDKELALEILKLDSAY